MLGITKGVLYRISHLVGKNADCFESQLDKLDFKGKVVKPFVTHEGSGFGKSKKTIKKAM